MGRKHQKCPKMGGGCSICEPPRFSFKNELCHFYPYVTPTSCKKLEKTNEQSLSYLKTDEHTHGRTRAITKDSVGWTHGSKKDKMEMWAPPEKKMHRIHFFTNLPPVPPRAYNYLSCHGHSFLCILYFILKAWKQLKATHELKIWNSSFTAVWDNEILNSQ